MRAKFGWVGLVGLSFLVVANEHPSAASADRCCKTDLVFYDQDVRVQPCGCGFKNPEECDAATPGHCLYRSNYEIEGICVEKGSQNDCEIDSNCAWRQDFENQSGFCYAMLCREMTCGEIDDPNICSTRHDCQWSGRACSQNLNCDCADPDDMAAYCGCLNTKSLCDGRFSCSWADGRGCYDPETSDRATAG